MAADTTQAIEVVVFFPDELSLPVSIAFGTSVNIIDATAMERGSSGGGNGGGAGGGTGGDAQSIRPTGGQIFPRGY